MRIVAGRLKGKRFEPPSGFRGRPTTDFAREALFNVLENHISFEGIAVCDLFAGTGALGFESYSRGADRVVAVEQNPRAVLAIKKHMAEFNMDGSMVFRADVFDFLRRNKEKFDLVLADPPFDMPRCGELVETIMSGARMLNSEGLLVLEHGPDQHFKTSPWFEDERKYGHVHFSFFRPSQA